MLRQALVWLDVVRRGKQYSSFVNTKRVGNTSEAKALAAFVERGWVVLLPFGDTEPYDLVIDRGNGFERVQVKTGRRYKGCLVFNGYSISGRGATQVTSTYANKIDLFAVYLPTDDQIYLVPVDSVGSKPTLRLDPAVKQHASIRWAHDFLLP